MTLRNKLTMWLFVTAFLLQTCSTLKRKDWKPSVVFSSTNWKMGENIKISRKRLIVIWPLSIRTQTNSTGEKQSATFLFRSTCTSHFEWGASRWCGPNHQINETSGRGHCGYALQRCPLFFQQVGILLSKDPGGNLFGRIQNLQTSSTVWKQTDRNQSKRKAHVSRSGTEPSFASLVPLSSLFEKKNISSRCIQILNKRSSRQLAFFSETT